MSPLFQPAAPGWTVALNQYLAFREVHQGLQSGSWSSWLRLFTRQVVSDAPTPANLTLESVDAWISRLAQRPLSARTVRGYVGTVRAFIHWLRAERLLTADLATFMESPLTWQDATVPGYFTWEEVQRLLGSIDAASPTSLHDRALLLLFVTCGLRAGEVSRLAVSDVNLAQQTARIRQRKNGTFLVLPLPVSTVEALHRYFFECRPEGYPEAFFLTWQGRPYRTGCMVSKQVRRLAEQAGLGRQRGAQALRRAVGTRLVEQGATLPQVALMLGHNGLQSARHYVRASMALLTEVADNYAEFL